MIEPDTDITNSPLFLLNKAAAKWQRLQQQILVQHQLTYTQYIILAALIEQSQAAMQKDIVGWTGLDKMVVSQTVKGLQAKNLVSIHASVDDARATAVRVSAKAKNIIMAVSEDMAVLDEQLATALEHDLAYFEFALKHIAQ